MRLACEYLEIRCTPAIDVFPVNTNLDTPDVAGDKMAADAQGRTSLRSVLEFLIEVPGRVRVGNWQTDRYVIDFAAVQGDVISLTGGALPDLTSNLEFLGNNVTLERPFDAVGQFRLLDVKPGTETKLFQMALLNGMSGGDGGAVRNLGKLTVEGCSLYNNSAVAGSSGAIVSFQTSALTILNSSFWGNLARVGGAIHASNKTGLIIRDSDIFANSAIISGMGEGGFGGGVSINTDAAGVLTPTITNSRIYGNEASKDGGGLYIQDTHFTMTGGELHGNESKSGFGGGIYVHGADKTAELDGVKLTNNAAGQKGGGGYVMAGTLNLTLTEFTKNTATGGIAGAGKKKDVATGTLNAPAGSQTYVEDP